MSPLDAVRAFLAVATLSACSQETTTTNAAAPAAEQVAQAQAAAELAEVRMPQDTEGLGGELSCSFRDEAGRLLLLGSGIVQAAEPSKAAIRIGETGQLLQSSEAGGYDAMVDGATFTNGAVSVTIAPGAEQPDGSEQVHYAATATLAAAAAQRVYTGVWTCGP